MEFKRIEVRKVLRYREAVVEPGEIKKILQELFNQNLEFSIKLQNMGGALCRCTVVGMADDKVSLFSISPRKVTASPTYAEIEQIEVESNCDFIAEEHDEGGRWSRLM